MSNMQRTLEFVRLWEKISGICRTRAKLRISTQKATYSTRFRTISTLAQNTLVSLRRQEW